MKKQREVYSRNPSDLQLINDLENTYARAARGLQLGKLSKIG
jgi:hypothetical protein